MLCQNCFTLCTGIQESTLLCNKKVALGFICQQNHNSVVFNVCEQTLYVNTTETDNSIKLIHSYLTIAAYRYNCNKAYSVLHCTKYLIQNSIFILIFVLLWKYFPIFVLSFDKLNAPLHRPTGNTFSVTDI